MSQVKTEVGLAVGSPMSLGWIKANSAFAYSNLNSIRGLTWFKAVSSQNSCTRTAGSTTTNCAANCSSQQNYSGYAFPQSNCNAIASTNCNQCGYDHGTYLQANCNCNCNCWVCNCSYSNCNCNCDCSNGCN